jgi:hypothetical protein
MRISRIFRKYSRVLLLVFMSLLLVVFLIGDVIGRARYSGTAEDYEVGQAFGEPVHQSQIRRAELDFDVAGRIIRAPRINSTDPQERGLAKYLLMEEARRAGIHVGRNEIIAGLRDAPGASAVLSGIRRETGRSLNSIYDAAARVQATMVLVSYQLGAAAGVSLPELERAYRDANQEARVLISVIDSKPLAEQVPEPTEEELQAHFEEAKDRKTEHTEEALVFGYRIPDRVQIEYLTVDPAQIEESVYVSRKETENYYQDNQHKYTKPVEDTSSFGFEDAQPRQVPMTYEEAEEQVREDCRRAKAIREAQALVNAIHEEALRPWISTALAEDGTHQAPPQEALVPFTELQATSSSKYPVIYKKTELVTQNEVRLEPGFGRASVVIDRVPVRTATLAFRVEGLAAASKDDPTPILRLNEPSPVVIESRRTDPVADLEPYQAYLFRVVRVEPTGPPASLDNVREELVKDVEQRKAFEFAGEKARALAERARQVGLKQAVAEAEDLKAMLSSTEEASPTADPAAVPRADRYVRMLEPVEPEVFLRRPSPRYLVPNVAFAPNLHEKAFALAEESGTDAADTHRVVAVPLARNLRWAVVELLEVKPIYRGDFEMKRQELEQQTIEDSFGTCYERWFTPEYIFARAGYVPAARTEP